MIPQRLEKLEWLERTAVQTIFAALGGDDGKTRAVGGIVRDSLIGRVRDSNDIDMATELLPVAVMQKAKAAGIATYPTGIDHGTVTLRLDETSVEVTTLRQDVETDGRHAQVRFGTDWTMDAQRRDFTINALYCGPDGALFDPLGGAGDLINGRVRFIGDAGQRIAEDGLRVYRFFRFSASHGNQVFDPEGLAACRDAADELDHISRERVGAEMVRMLALPLVARTLAIMDGLGLVRMERVSVAALERYEALGGMGVEARMALLGGDVGRLRSEWRLSNAMGNRVERITAASDLIARGDVAWAAYRFGEEAVEGLAVTAAREDWQRDRLMETARDLGRLPVAPLPVNGQDLTERGMKPGPEMGSALAMMERAWVESGFLASREELLAQLF
ncbi:MAG: CCA tRNA nucleotidyltransferase [Phyllobacteriaceae bacterium]|nr:CCA tRNA nucleotidyltransferase [Phyllobacteriaceae bacterium]